MSRSVLEQEAIDAFRERLEAKTGVSWKTSPDEVQNPLTNRKYDAEFTTDSGCHGPIAAEVTRIVEESRERSRNSESMFVGLLLSELRDCGLGGFGVEHRVFSSTNPRRDKERARRIVDQVIAKRREGLTKFDIETGRRGEFLRFKVWGTTSDPCVFRTPGECSLGEPARRLLPQISRALERKSPQLGVPGHTNVLIAVPDRFVAAGDVAKACALIDFSQYPAFDQILSFAGGDLSLVFSRSTFEALERGTLPEREEDRSLGFQWLSARLGFACWPTLAWDQGAFFDWVTAKYDIGRCEAASVLKHGQSSCHAELQKAFHEMRTFVREFAWLKHRQRALDCIAQIAWAFEVPPELLEQIQWEWEPLMQEFGWGLQRPSMNIFEGR